VTAGAKAAGELALPTTFPARAQGVCVWGGGEGGARERVCWGMWCEGNMRTRPIEIKRARYDAQTQPQQEE
jgi:hypothetical protein